MAQVKITDLSAIPSIAGNEIFPIIQGNSTLKCTITQAQNAMGVYTGTGAPTVTAANGSMYLRNDGTAVTTVYCRINGSWIAQG